ncbi:MAG: hypothetical protein JWP29_3523 [Rhodoferax sp.]|nr:hypothetical protein [Rhodoferax sp.]
MFDRQDAELARLRQRITDVESERDRVEEDRDRGWSIGRYWFNEAHEAAGIARNAQAVASALMKYAPPEVAAEHKGWTPLILPAFEAPYPKPKPE